MGPFTKWLIQHAIEKFLEHELRGFTDGKFVEGSDGVASPAHFQRLQIRYDVSRSGLQTDVYENVIHFVRSDAPNVGTEATDTQKASIETAFGTFWGNVKSYCNPEVALSMYRWYGLTFTDPLSGPPTRVSDVTNVAGTAAAPTIPQASTSITMRTPSRRHWGRIYLPGAKLSPGGFMSNTDTDSLASYFRTFVLAAAAGGLTPVIYSPAKEALMSVSDVEVDNVVDVVRRRRPKASTYKKILSS